MGPKTTPGNKLTPEERAKVLEPRTHGGEDPRAETPPLSEEIALEMDHPPSVDLHFLAGLAVGDRRCRQCVAEAELRQRESAQRVIRPSRRRAMVARSADGTGGEVLLMPGAAGG
jgi:hypothetical protein